MYDYAHGQSDSIERITHSLCSLEFENHRPLYEWFIQKLGIYAPRQIEFARLSLTYTVMSKRLLLELVQGRHVDGWDDPRMPTISGMRRRGYPPSAIRTFCDKIGVAKADSTVDVKLLEFCVREELNRTAPRRMAVLRPLKLTITNWPAGHVDEVELQNNTEDPEQKEEASDKADELGKCVRYEIADHAAPFRREDRDLADQSDGAHQCREEQCRGDDVVGGEDQLVKFLPPKEMP